jgi:hypothetical protein
VGRAGPGPQLGWAVPDMGRARNCVLWAGLLGTAQMYTYMSCHSASTRPCIWLCKILFFIVYYIIYKVKFKICNGTRDEASKPPKTISILYNPPLQNKLKGFYEVPH